MSNRLELQALLESILGSEEAHFQPPANLSMTYPAIIYNLDAIKATHAGNKPYKVDTAYQIMIIDKNPDSALPLVFAKMEKCAWVDSYSADNLNHYIYRLYY